jgi:V-type H+-transporting ATPase subunit a
MVSARKWLGNFYFMSKSSHSLDFDETKDRNYSGGMIPNQKMTHFVGLIEARDFTSFSKTIFRITKGNFMIQNETLE